MQKYLPVLRNCPFFTGLTDDEILSILHCVSAAKITRPRGSYIFRAGESTEVMGLMLSGSTLVIQEDPWGHRNILSKCSTGDFFGEPYAATPGAILNISVVAEEDCEILLLNVIAKGLDKFPGIKRCGDNIRTAMSYVIDIALLIGGILAAQAIMPTTGLFIIVAFWCINKCSKKPLVSMAVGPLGAILVGLIANVLFLLSLYTPAA
jgi:hypothetical protein